MVVAAGIALAAAAIVVDRTGSSSNPSFGPSQQLALAGGVVLVVIGVVSSRPAGRARLRRVVLSRLALAVIATMVALVAAELAVRVAPDIRRSLGVAERGHPSADQLRWLDDPLLEKRFPALAPQHDERGFRNVPGLDRADVVVLGDSQSWGHNVDRSQAWPARLAATTGLTVYNMAVPTWGPLHYWSLRNEAASLEPRLVLLGLYLGNDLWDAARLATSLDAHRDHGRRFDPASCARVAAAGNAFAAGREAFFRAWQPTPSDRWVDWLRDHSAIATRLTRLGYLPGLPPSYLRSRAWAESAPDSAVTYDDGEQRTVVQLGAYVLTQDTSAPCLAEARHLTLDLIPGDGRGARATTGRGRCSRPRPPSSREPPATPLSSTHRRLVELEADNRAYFIDGLTAAGIETLDLRPALTRAFSAGEPIYGVDYDDHFIASGYARVAAEVEQFLVSAGLVPGLGR